MTTPLSTHFWQQHHRFLKTVLLTETPHPLTSGLSEWAKHDLAHGLEVLRAIDGQVLRDLTQVAKRLAELTTAIQTTLQAGQRVFILGCGASGRMAVNVEWLWRQFCQHNPCYQVQQVVSVMAGGDSALIRAIEQFEDQASFGPRQLMAQGFGANDLLIATTASGESPYILQALTHAAATGQRKPWLLFCNPEAQLLARDPAHPLALETVESFCLNVGPMALTGSTRMQATTAMLAILGVALLHPNEGLTALEPLQTLWQHCDFSALPAFIKAEASAYQQGQPCHYRVDPYWALTVLTDVTERAPTFNTPPIHNKLLAPTTTRPMRVTLAQAQTPHAAWLSLLQREPFCLAWPSHPATGVEYVYGFDLSDHEPIDSHCFNIAHRNGDCQWSLADLTATLPLHGLNSLSQQLALKLALNNHSTLMMGRLGHYQGNLMTWVSPSNAKLIDRTIRTLQYAWQQRNGETLAYEPLAEEVLALIPGLQPNESIIERWLNEHLS